MITKPTLNAEPLIRWGSLLCTAPPWPFPAGPVHLNVTRNAVPIDFDPAYGVDVFETRDGWEFVTPDAAPAIGTPHPNP